MEEIEVKIIEIDPAEIIRKLEKLGATKVFDGEMNSIYYDYHDEFKKKQESVAASAERGCLHTHIQEEARGY